MYQRNDNQPASESMTLASKMPNLEQVGCGAPATTRIELYSPRDGRAHGSLDASLYTCTEHIATVVEAAAQTGLTAHQIPLVINSARCGDGYDFTASTPLKASEPTPADVFGDDHPVISKAIEALTFGGEVDIESIPRDRAALLLDGWAHRHELTEREVAAVLARFPETVERPRINFSDFLEAYDLGKAVGQEQALRDIELLRRIDAKLRDAKQAYARGYCDGVRRRLNPERAHAFSVERAADDDPAFVWECRCGWGYVQLETDVTPIRETLLAHLEATR